MASWFDKTKLSSLNNADQVMVEQGGTTKNANMAQLKTYMGEGSAIPYLDVVNLGNDKGIISTEQFSVGTVANPKEFIAGADSYGVGKEDTTPDGDPVLGSAWHCTMDNTTGNTITSAMDRTVVLSSDSGSTVGFLNGVTEGNYLLLGSEYKWGGVKVGITNIGDVEYSNVKFEYLETSANWKQTFVSVVGSDYPAIQKANRIFQTGQDSEQWRFGFDPTNLPIYWEKVTLNINGTDYAKYWGRVRIESTITADAIVEQIKLHTNRTEFGDVGRELFGRHRQPIVLLNGVNATYPNALKSPANENLKISPEITIATVKNEFVNNKDDGFIIPVRIKTGIDTSIPLQLTIDCYPKTNNAGDIKLVIDYVYTGSDFVFDGTATPIHSENIMSFPANSKEKSIETTFLIPIDKLLPNEKCAISLYRAGSDPEDTLNTSAVITGVRLIGYTYK